ncbi:kinase [Listeria grandensis]|uniref:Kinase n=1 Tax=Listeria grandensis TaxID=1494963 RepID=A0A7X1CNJ4_9LIST|nr:kinase [Listeria grandensis]MBC1934961.1 kinase [Listeria grandensis]
MKSKLIILRGNSGSGKTTIAKKLQETLGDGTLLVSQDTVRRDMLHVRDRRGNLSINLIQNIASYGKNICPYVIVEGILGREIYQGMLQDLIQFFDNQADVYYFDLPFAETVKRHQTKDKAHEFGIEKLKAWWLINDKLGVENEIILTEKQSEEEIIMLILDKL